MRRLRRFLKRVHCHFRGHSFSFPARGYPIEVCQRCGRAQWFAPESADDYFSRIPEGADDYFSRIEETRRELSVRP